MSAAPLTLWPDLRAQVMAQPASERLEFAIALLEYVACPPPDWHLTAEGIRADLTPVEARTLHALAIRRGRLVPHGILIAAIPAQDATDPLQYVRNVIARLRVKAVAAGLPISIDTVRELGYRLHAADGYRFPHEIQG